MPYSLLYPLMAAGAATFAIPVIIHLIFRMRKRRIVFSSLRFLHQSMLKESRRLRLRELILLLLRCLACIFIALAFARPFINDLALAGSSGRPAEDAVIVLDDSPSMNAQEGTSTRWQNALRQAKTFLTGREARDRAGLVLSSDPARAAIELSSNFEAVASELKAEKPSALRGDLGAAMSTALDLLSTSTQTKRRVLVYSDFQSSGIDRGAWAALAQKAAAIGRGVSVELLGPESLVQGNVRLANLAITDVRAKSDVWIEGRPVPFIIRVANHGNSEVPNVSVKLTIDGKTTLPHSLGLGPRSTTEVVLDATFAKAGEVSGYAEVEAHDAFPDDDKRLVALKLRDSVKVLVIEEKHSEVDPVSDEGYYVRMALEPKARGAEEVHAAGAAANYVTVNAVNVDKVTPEDYRNTDLIVMVGVASMTAAQLAQLEDAVRDGKNLVLFVGRSEGRISEGFYNGLFWKDGYGLLPAKPGTYFEGSELENKFDKIGIVPDPNHPLFKPFIGENDSMLRLARFYRHYRVDVKDLKEGSDSPDVQPKTPVPEPKKEDEKKKQPPRPEGKVLALFTGDNGPFVVERPFGKGTVLMFPFAPYPETRELPRQPITTLTSRAVFLPLMHQAVRWLAGVQSASRRNLTAGDTFDFADAGATPEAKVTLEKPGANANAPKETIALNGNDHPVANQTGIYAASFLKGAVKERTLWAVNLDSRESELASETIGSLKNIFSSVTQDEAAAKAQLQQLSDEQKRLAPEWRYCLAIALACLLLEVVLRDFWKS